MYHIMVFPWNALFRLLFSTVILIYVLIALTVLNQNTKFLNNFGMYVVFLLWTYLYFYILHGMIFLPFSQQKCYRVTVVVLRVVGLLLLF